MVQNGSAVSLRKQGIAWPSDVQQKFKNPTDPLPANMVRVIPDLTDEDFIVWMRTAGLPDFNKLYRIIDTDVLPGNYQFVIQNSIRVSPVLKFPDYPVESFKGAKYLHLSTTSWLGGKNPFLGYAFIIVGVLCIVFGAVFAIKHRISPRYYF